MQEGDGHGRFEELAVGHVLGGLPTREAAVFRSHLLECRECRRHVAELRDIAADLAQAEREERRRAATKIEVARRQGPEDDDVEPPWWRGPIVMATAGVLVVVLLLGLLVWNYHLRQGNRELLTTTTEREQVIETLAGGELVDVDLYKGVRGVVAVTGDGVAVSLVGIPEVAGEQVVVWLLDDDDGAVWRHPVTPSAGRLALHERRRGADWLVVSQQAGPLGEGPTGDVLTRAKLTEFAATSAPPA